MTTADTLDRPTDSTNAAVQAPGVLTEVKALSLPDMVPMTTGANAALRMANSFVITTDDDYALAGEELSSIKGRLKRLEELRTSITGPMNKALDAVNGLFRGPKETLTSAETAYKSSMLAYHTEKERKAAEERRKAEELAEAERQRIAAEARRVEQEAAAERTRIANEAAAKAEAARAEQEALDAKAKAAQESGDQAAAQAAAQAAESLRLQSELDAQQALALDSEVSVRANETAAALRNTAAVVTSLPVATTTAKATGTSVRTTVDYEVTSLQSLVEHIAKNPTLINLVMTDSTKLRAYVRGLGTNCNLPGVRVFNKASMSAKAA